MGRILAGSTDRAAAANSASLQNLPAGVNGFAGCAWGYVGSDVDNCSFFAKATNVGTNGWWVALVGDGGSNHRLLRCRINFQGGIGDRIADITQKVPIGPAFIAWSYNPADATQKIRLYFGGLTGILTEITSFSAGFTSDGTGVYTLGSLDNAADLTIGSAFQNGLGFGTDNVFQEGAVFNSFKTKRQLQDIRDTKVFGSSCVWTGRMGYLGNANDGVYEISGVVQDLSGNSNHATLSGSSVLGSDVEDLYRFQTSDFIDTFGVETRSTHLVPSSLSRILYSALTCTDIQVCIYSTNSAAYPDSCNIGIKKDNATATRMDMGFIPTGPNGETIDVSGTVYNRYQWNSLNIGSGSKKIEIITGNAGLSSMISSVLRDITSPVSIRFFNGSTVVGKSTFASSQDTQRVTAWLIQDSLHSNIFNNAVASNNNTGSPVIGAWPMLARMAGWRIVCDSWGGHSVERLTCVSSGPSGNTTYDSTKTNTQIAAIVAANPRSVIISLMANDLNFANTDATNAANWRDAGGSNSWTTYKNRFTTYLTALRAALPASIPIYYCQSTNMTGLLVDGLTDVDNLRLAGAAISVAGCTYKDLRNAFPKSPYVTSGRNAGVNNTDTVHPGYDGHALMDSYIRGNFPLASLSSGDSNVIPAFIRRRRR